ncbi:peroxisome biogenesis protein 16 [Nymphaea colorata]|nr:peroxisome biogenesis protein 16 [Nymphaea colorata]XP_031496101.1 peroxisome biogenesis protein 16 [Nymphaea colorata]XP_031496102.1 peroxisome biogenesis protein 16 [Nymphaea colorata]
MEAYRRWVWKNREFVHSLETFVNGLTWLLPERFSDSEIAPEAVTSILGIVAGINQHIIEKSAAQIQFGVQDHGFPWSLCLSAVKELETLVEVVAQHFYGDDKKWNSIALTEAIKAMIRLIMMRESGYKMLLNGGVTLNIGDALDVSQPSVRNPSMQSVTGKPGTHYGPGHFYDFRDGGPHSLEGRAMVALSRFGENAKMNYQPTWLSRSQSRDFEQSDAQQEKPTLASVFSEKGLVGAAFVFGEVLYIMRPVIYVLFIRKYGLRSWIPWFSSLSIDILAMSLLSFTSNLSRKGKNSLLLSAVEKDELKRRKLLWAFYILRDPFFSKYTRHHLENSEKILNPIPFVGFFTAKLVELIIGAQTRYTYTSAS